MQKLGKTPITPSVSKGKGKKWFYGAGAVAGLVVLSVISTQGGFNLKASKPAAAAEDPADHELAAFEAFAQKVTIALNNISFVNLVPDSNNEIPYFKTLNPYFDQATQFKVQNSFMDTEHQQKV